MTRKLVLGVLSGTSADGIDVAAVSGLPGRPRIVAAATYPFRRTTREAVRRAVHMTLAELNALDRELAEDFAAAVRRLLRAHRLRSRDVAVIGSHGQTLWHAPRVMSTQRGAPAVIAARTGIAVAADFRVDDIAAGGEGAPLVPVLDELLLGPRSRARRIAALNIGGIANVTLLSRGRVTAAFDTGPGNGLIDAAMRRFCGRPCDRDGVLAASGRVDAVLLRRLLAHPYYTRRPPKSTGLEMFGEEYLARVLAGGRIAPRDAVATLTELTALTVARELRRFDAAEVWVAGGGLRNPTLMARLADLCRPTKVHNVSELGIDPDYKEAVLFALLGHYRLRGRAVDLRRVTGSRRSKVLGGLWLP